MLNMLKLFYKELSNKIINYFENRGLVVGEKFHIQFEKEEHVQELYAALKETENTASFTYTSEHATYNTYALAFGEVSLIVAATVDEIKPDFLTYLRNKVGTEDPQFNQTAILFIHHTTLDSITKGTEGLQKEGMPLHVGSVVKDLKKDIEDSSLTSWEKKVIQFALDRKFQNGMQDYSSLFEYEEVLEILHGGEVTQEYYDQLGLFYYVSPVEGKDKEQTKVLEKNAELYAIVESAHKHGNPATDLEKYFDDKGINKLKKESWKEISFEEVKASYDEKQEEKPIDYHESVVFSAEALNHWEREEGKTKAKQRVKNIIVFNPIQLEAISIELLFDQPLQKEFVHGTLSSKVSGKKLTIYILHQKGQNTFGRVIYKDPRGNYTFKIAVVEVPETFLQKYKSQYLIQIGNDNRIILQNEEEYLLFNPDGSEEIEESYTTINQFFHVNQDQKLQIHKKNMENDDETELLRLNIKLEHTTLPLAILEQSNKPVVITGHSVWKQKRELKQHFVLCGENKLIQGTSEYFTRDEFRRNLERERFIIEHEALYAVDTHDCLEVGELSIDAELKKIYTDIVMYFRVNELLPSLTYYHNDIRELCKKYVQKFTQLVQEIPQGGYLSQEQKNLIKLGTIERQEGFKEILLTALHPLNIAYQIQLYEKVGDEKLGDELLKKLSPINLLPYLYNEQKKLYKPAEQSHSPEWYYYIEEKLPRYNASRSFVAKLVSEKIEEFVKHFSYLFSLTSQSPLRLNLINLGDAREVLQGIFLYYNKQIKNGIKFNQILPIELYIYQKGNMVNAFEAFAFYEDAEEIKRTFEVKLEPHHCTEEDILNLFREKVHYYKKEMDPHQLEYCHISFYQMDPHITETISNMEHLPTGISLEGLVSGIPSVYAGGSYRTGFGTKYMCDQSNILLDLSIQYNLLARSARKLDPFSNEQCIITAIADEDKVHLETIYNRSHWVTFIDPKVDLHFFKNDVNAKDLLIIHYSDQYTSSSGYDAITVTRRSAQYQAIIEEFLRNKNIKDVQKHSPNIINFFNAVNGDWLLRLISHVGQFPREKISILSAIKVALAYFYHPDIIWVPLSLEEVLRVSGGAGLKKSEGLFSAKNLGVTGSHSDDLLLVGIENKNDKVKVYFYPVEVKIGYNETCVITKAKEQVYQTNKLLKQFLKQENFTSAMYRNFFMQLVIVSAEKMKLYEIWNEQNWDEITQSELRMKLLNDQYEISDELDTKIGKGAVISFRKEVLFKSVKQEDQVLLLEFSEADGSQYIIADTEDLKNRIIEGHTEISTERLLFYTKDVEKGIKELEIESVVEPEQQPETIEPPQVKDPPSTYLPSAAKEENSKINTIVDQMDPMEILFGYEKENSKAVKWFPTSTDKIMHTNTGIIGTMGTGKTQFTKSLITQLHQMEEQNVGSAPIGILIFDYKGDYIKEDFVQANQAKIYDLYHLPFNPLALFMGDKPKHLLPLHTASSLKETISTAFGLGVKQQALLRDVIMEAYEKRGIKKNDMSTWSLLPPTLKDVVSLYLDKEDVKEDSLYAALTNLYEFEIFEPDPKETQSLFEIVDGVTVINLSGYDEGIQNLVVAITLDLFYAQMQVSGHSKIDGNYRQITKMILVDEADNFLSKNFSSLKKILKEGREFGVGTILSTQLLSHFSTAENEYANYILTWVVHNVSDINNKDVRYIFNTQSKAEEDNILNRIKKLEKHYSIVKLGGSEQPKLIRDKAFWELVKEE